MRLPAVSLFMLVGSVLVFGEGCEQKPAAPVEDAPAPKASAGPQPVYLVWALDETGAPTTWLVEPSEGASHHVLGRRPELWLGAGERVWQWAQEQVPFATEGCGLEEDSVAASNCKAVRPRVTLRPMLGNRPVEIHDPAREGDTLTGAVEEVVVPKMGVGPYLFVEQAATWSGCGAHDSAEHTQLVIDLTRGEVMPRPAQLTGELPVATALANLRKERQEEFDEGSLTVSAMFPSYRQGKLELRYQMTADTCYACSDGDWSSYTVSTQVPAPQLPAQFEPYAELPEAVADFVRTHVDTPTWGWSETTLDARHRDALSLLFEAAPQEKTLASVRPSALPRG